MPRVGPRPGAGTVTGPSFLPRFLRSPDQSLCCFSAAKTTTKSLTLMLTVISDSNFPYFDGSILYNFTIVCFALLRLLAGELWCHETKETNSSSCLCEETLLGCCLVQVILAAADNQREASYISCTWEHLYNCTLPACDNYSTRRM